MKTYTVPAWKFKEIEAQLQTTITDKISSSFFFQNQEFVCNSAMGDGTGLGWRCLFAHRIADLRLYTGALKPMQYTDHYYAIKSGARERGLQGLLVQYKARKVVLLEECRFESEPKNESQKTLF